MVKRKRARRQTQLSDAETNMLLAKHLRTADFVFTELKALLCTKGLDYGTVVAAISNICGSLGKAESLCYAGLRRKAQTLLETIHEP